MNIDSGIMPAITLYQPWASWIIWGLKTIETRTHNRFKSLKGSRILIHAGKKTDESDSVVRNPYITFEQLIYKHEELINGYIIGSALVQDFRVLDEKDSKAALIDCGNTLRYGLILNESLTFSEPIKINGEMGIWYYDVTNKCKVRKSNIEV